MKYGILWLCLLPSLAAADIYKSIDRDGHVTYSSAPIKGGNRIVLSQPVQSAPAPARIRNTQPDFPTINRETQRGRDDTRRKILEDELKAEQGLLNTAKLSLQAAEQGKPKDAEQIGQLTKQTEAHQKNITALNTELSRLK